MEDRKPEVALWAKDGMWHYTERYEPTEDDRKRYPVSYPEGDSGPFFKWAAKSFYTELEAIEASEQSEKG